MNYHWQLKKKRSPNMTNKKIDYLYDYAIDNGAIGGKLIGAGGGGFLMFYSKKPNQLIGAFKNKLSQLDYKFDHVGLKIIE